MLTNLIKVRMHINKLIKTQSVYLFLVSDSCISSPCANNGNCTNVPGSFTCNCTEEWTGATCDQCTYNEVLFVCKIQSLNLNYT